MFPYYLLPGNKPKPKPKKPSSYLPSYITVYVKPDPPPAQASIPDDILPFVNPNPAPSQPEPVEYNPLSSIQAPKRGSGKRGSSSSRDSRREKSVGNGASENSGAREIVPDRSLPDIADVPFSGVDPADLKFYFAARDHDLARSVEAALTHEGLPARYETEPAKYVRDNFAEHGMDAEADAAAEEYARKYAEEMGLQRAQQVTREVIEDLANDEMESVVAVDRDTGEIIFVRYGDRDSVALQEEQRKLAEGRNIVLIHNHWNNTGASLADLGAADWLDAERMVVVTPSGKRYYYHRRGGRLVSLKPVQGTGVAAESDPVETAVARLLHMMQSAREAGNPAEWVMEEGDLTADDVPLGLTTEQAWLSIQAYATLAYGEKFITLPSDTRQSVISDWKSTWFDNPESWIDYKALNKRLSIVEDAVQKWNHPASGMSNDEMAALLMGNLHREAHYRRQEPSVYKMNPGEFGLNLGDRGATYVGNLFRILTALVGYGDGDPSVGPANLRIQVVNEILGTNDQEPYIPMPEEESAVFYDMGRLDHWSRMWQNLTNATRPSAADRRRLLNNDRFAIEIMAANVYRGVERLYQQYLDKQKVREDYRQHQRLLAQGAVAQYRQERSIPQHFLEQAGRQKQYLQQYLQQDEDRATMFNLSTWLNQGIAESNDLRTKHDNQAVTAAIDHARETLPFISAILENEAFGLSPSEDGFIMFNENDLHSYLRD